MRVLAFAAMVLIAIIGLYMASQAVDPVFEGVGLFLFAFGVLANFRLIHRYVGAP